ncbi:MAG TPA: hypothetical protein VM578_07015 [Candidatus Saccharimonadales bacterium]|nr:hypothetical protein [Candidatus Saccharimonadales bacterium]
MNFLASLLRGISFVPAVVHGVEALFGSKSGGEKKQAVMSFVGAALGISGAVAGKQIVDEAGFSTGLSKVIDGVVDCMNASVWAKAK